MGIAYRPQRRRPWMAYWRDPQTGRQHSRCFATEDEARQFEAWQKRSVAREADVPKTKPASKVTVQAIIRAYLEHYTSESVTSKKQAEYHARHVVRVLGRRQAMLLDAEALVAFAREELGRGISQLTINRRVCVLRTALSWAVEQMLLPFNPISGVRLSKGRARRFAPPTPAEAERIMRCAAPHVARVVLLGVWTGARVGPSELFRISWDDVDLNSATIRIWSAQKNKARPWRDVPIRASFIPILREWQEQDDVQGIAYLIHWGGRPVQSIHRAWQTALRRAGITRRVRPYDLRHAFATFALEHGADIKALADLMGHRDPTMILRTYQHVQESQRRQCVEAVPDITDLATWIKSKRTT